MSNTDQDITYVVVSDIDQLILYTNYLKTIHHILI